jgi:hypothetical protein
VLWSLDDVYRKQSNMATSICRDIQSRQQTNTKRSTEFFIVSRMGVLEVALEVVFSLETISGKLAPRIWA